MVTSDLLTRINELARKRRTQGLNAEELAEQAHLRRVYLDGIKDQLRNMLDSIEFIDTPPMTSAIPTVLHQANITLGQNTVH